MSRKELFVVARATLKEFGKDDLSLLAAAVTYFAFFSIFPLLLLGVTIVTMLSGSREEAMDFITGTLEQAVDPGSAQLIRDALVAALNNRDNTGLLLAVGLITLAFSASSAFGTLDKAINRAWDAGARSNFFKGKLVSFLMMLGMAFVLVLSVFASAALTRTRHITTLVIGQVPGIQIFWWLVNILLSLLIVFLVFASLYRFLPRLNVSLRDVWMAALLAAAAWVLLKELFALYLGSAFGDYGRTYGTLGTVITLLTWIYLSALIILGGAEFAAETYEVRRLRDEVTGASPRSQPEPAGSPWFSGDRAAR